MAEDVGFDFGTALSAVQAGKQVARLAWGPARWICLVKGFSMPISVETAKATGLPKGTPCKYTPYLLARGEHDSFAPWVPSHADLLATDWVVVR